MHQVFRHKEWLLGRPHLLKFKDTMTDPLKKCRLTIDICSYCVSCDT